MAWEEKTVKKGFIKHRKGYKIDTVAREEILLHLTYEE